MCASGSSTTVAALRMSAVGVGSTSFRTIIKVISASFVRSTVLSIGHAGTPVDPEGRIHAEHVVPGYPLRPLDLADEQVRSSMHQVDEQLPSTALVGRREQDAQDVALTELLPHVPERDPIVKGLCVVIPVPSIQGSRT